MDHIVPTRTDASEMALPVSRVFSHEFTDGGEDGDGGQRQRTPVKGESRSDIDVVKGGFLGLNLPGRAICLGFC